MDFQTLWNEYTQKREQLVKDNANLLGVKLLPREKQLDRFLTELKKEYAGRNCGKDFYDIPVLTDSGIHESRLYRFCSEMPKGADLHVHDMSLLPVCELIPLLKQCPEFCVNTNHASYDLICVNPEEPVPKGYLRFPEALARQVVSEEELLANWTLLDADRSGMERWPYFEMLFSRHGVLSDNPAFAEKYYDYAFRYYYRHHIQHIEIRLMLPESMEDSITYLKMLRRVRDRVRKDCPALTVKVISAGMKADSPDLTMTRNLIRNTAQLQKLVRNDEGSEEGTDFVIGFDLVNEEDTSLPIYAFAPDLLMAKTDYPNMRFFIHSGESINAGNENLLDAYLLGASRVGHGLNLYRYPDLHGKYTRSEICLEVCPISNQALGYTRDLRNHPATEYLRTGVPIALCSDDPTYMEHESLTDDFFAAIVCWDLNVADLKQLAINSIVYSGLSGNEKTEALKNLRVMWDAFVNRILEHGL